MTLKSCMTEGVDSSMTYCWQSGTSVVSLASFECATSLLKGHSPFFSFCHAKAASTLKMHYTYAPFSWINLPHETCCMVWLHGSRCLDPTHVLTILLQQDFDCIVVSALNLEFCNRLMFWMLGLQPVTLFWRSCHLNGRNRLLEMSFRRLYLLLSSLFFLCPGTLSCEESLPNSWIPTSLSCFNGLVSENCEWE